MKPEEFYELPFMEWWLKLDAGKKTNYMNQGVTTFEKIEELYKKEQLKKILRDL